MALTGLNRIVVRPRGGVAKVELVLANTFAAQPDPASGFATYVFREDMAHYECTSVGEPTRPLTEHTLVMELPAVAETRVAVEQLRRSCGVVAIITLASGETLTVGHTPTFGTAYPLRVTAVESTSGLVPGDFPTVKITLQCTDNSIL